MKTYTVDVQLFTQEFRVKAKNAREAKKKALAQLSRRNPVRMIDHRNTFTDEI